MCISTIFTICSFESIFLFNFFFSLLLRCLYCLLPLDENSITEDDKSGGFKRAETRQEILFEQIMQTAHNYSVDNALV